MKKIGKGTGRYADRHRRQARKYMQEARGAVPVWIMPRSGRGESPRQGCPGDI